MCAADNPCLDAFYCSATTNGTCLSKRTLGQACSPQDVCLSGLSCRSTLGVVVSPSSSICVTTAKLGEACGPTTFCDNAAGLFCGSKNVCRVPGQTSDYCATDSECASGLYCVGGTCNPPGGYGAQCTSNKNCKTDFVCDTHSPSPTNGQCVQKGGSGSSCPCLSGFDCVDSICAARGGVNSFCGSAHYPRCSDNLICTGGGVSTPGTCKALGGVGDFCSSNGSGWPPCATGLTCSSTNHCAAGLGEGGDCWGTRSSLPCAEGFICVVKSGKGSCTSTCSSINGTLCGTSNNYACRYTPGIHLGDKPMSCIRKLPYGSGCVSDNDPYSAPCMTDLFCSPSLTSCQFRSLKGESCSMDGVSMPRRIIRPE